MPENDMTAEDWCQGLCLEEQPAVSAGKRLGVRWCPWMGDWFTSWSPRNDNESAEGSWDHWVDLALKILADPMTEIVRPDAYRAGPEPIGFYAETNVDLTPDQLRDRFERRTR